LLHGENRQLFLDSLDKNIAKAKDEIVQRVDEDPTPDKLSDLVMNVMRDAGLEHFSLVQNRDDPKPSDPEQTKLARCRIQLLAQRRHLREQLVTANFHARYDWDALTLEANLHQVHVTLQQVQKQLKKVKHDREQRLQETVGQQIGEHWHFRRSREAWREAMGHCCTAPGRRFRRFDKVTLCKATAEQWEKRCVLPGPDGGFQGEVIDFDKERDNIIGANHREHDPDYCVVPTADHLLMAETVVQRMRNNATRLRPNKSIVDFSIPNEVLRMVLRPRWTYKPRHAWGLGHVKHYQVSRPIYWLLVQLVAKIMATRMTPVIWHMANGFTVQKANYKPGILGERLVAAMCCLSRLFYQICLDHPMFYNPDGSPLTPSDIVKKRDLPEEHNDALIADWQFGCIPGRRREEAIRAANIHTFLLVQAGLYVINSLYDGANAFWSVNHDDVISSAEPPLHCHPRRAPPCEATGSLRCGAAGTR